MAIYRGPGGPGDAVADAASEAALISALVTQAQTAETNAGNSASAAGVSASSASASASNAASSASTASTAASNAASSASSASTSASNAASSASSASTSASNASSSASSAASSASSASTSASNAASSASAAATSATNASNSASSAATSASNAAASYDAFDDRYLGAKSSAPTLDNDGNALLTGALYWNTVGNQLYVWDGSAWDAAAFNILNGLTTGDIGVTVQAYDAGLQSIAGLTTAANKMIYTTASDTYAVTDLTAAGRAILDDADTAAQRTTLGLVIGTDVQAYDSNLTSFVNTFTLPTTDGTNGQVLQTNGSGTLSFTTPTGGGITTGKAIAMAIVFG